MKRQRASYLLFPQFDQLVNAKILSFCVRDSKSYYRTVIRMHNVSRSWRQYIESHFSMQYIYHDLLEELRQIFVNADHWVSTIVWSKKFRELIRKRDNYQFDVDHRNFGSGRRKRSRNETDEQWTRKMLQKHARAFERYYREIEYDRYKERMIVARDRYESMKQFYHAKYDSE